MKIVANATTLQDIVNVVLTIIPEAIINIDKDGLHIVSMDIANAAFISVDAPPTVFSEFDLEKPIKIAVEFDRLKDYINIGGKKSIVTLSKEDGVNRLDIKVDRYNYKLGLLDLSVMKKCNMPKNIEFTASIGIDAESLNAIINAAGAVNDEFDMIKTTGQLLIDAHGDIDGFSTVVSDSELSNVATKCENVKSRFSVEYLKEFGTVFKKATTPINMRYGIDMPLELKFKLNEIDVMYLLAPRIIKE
jgi:DNA polymerase III sliding clamp (beta) subunit (PCNA family)